MKRKKHAVPKKLRVWYRMYCQQMKEHGEQPYPIKIWAGIEAHRYNGTARGKLLSRFCKESTCPGNTKRSK